MKQYSIVILPNAEQEIEDAYIYQKRLTNKCVELVSRDLPKDSIAFFIAVTMPIGSSKWFLWRRNPSFDYSKLPHFLYYYSGYCLYSSCTIWTSAVAKGEGTTLIIPVVVTCANCSWNTFRIEPAHLHLENLQSSHLVRLSLKVINRPVTDQDDCKWCDRNWPSGADEFTFI